jgi:hypothetical protein
MKSKGSCLYLKTTIFYDNHIQRYRNSLPLPFLGYTLHKALPTGYVHIVQIKVPFVCIPSPISHYLYIYNNGNGFICLVLFTGNNNRITRIGGKTEIIKESHCDNSKFIRYYHNRNEMDQGDVSCLLNKKKQENLPPH